MDKMYNLIIGLLVLFLLPLFYYYQNCIKRFCYPAIPNSTFNRIACLITVYMTIERCLCFVMPLRVKNLITPRRSAVIVVVIFCLFSVTLPLAYMALQLDWRFDLSRNRTMIMAVHVRPDSGQLLRIRTALNLTLQMFSLFGLVIGNIALFFSVQKQTNWRSQAAVTSTQLNDTAAANADVTRTAYRNKRLARMIQLLSLVLFITYFSSTVLFISTLIVPKFSFYGLYRNAYMTSWMVAVVSQTLNSSVNIVFYYRMNARFRNTFSKLFKGGAARIGILMAADHNTVDNTVITLTRTHR